MCAVCDVEDNVAATHVFVPKDILQTVYLTERAILGEPAGEQMWNIYFGLESGSIPWVQHEKMRLCHQAALRILAGRADEQKVGTRFRLGRKAAHSARTRKTIACSV